MKQLRITTSKPYSMFSFDENDGIPLVKPETADDIVMDALKGESAYLDGDAQRLAGFDIPIFLDGDMRQLDAPDDKQDILLLLPSGEFACKAVLQPSNTYYITLKQTVEE